MLRVACLLHGFHRACADLVKRIRRVPYAEKGERYTHLDACRGHDEINAAGRRKLGTESGLELNGGKICHVARKCEGEAYICGGCMWRQRRLHGRRRRRIRRRWGGWWGHWRCGRRRR